MSRSICSHMGKSHVGAQLKLIEGGLVCVL